MRNKDRNVKKISRQLQDLNELDEAISEIRCGSAGDRLRFSMHDMAKQALKGSRWRIDRDYEFCEWVVAKRVA